MIVASSLLISACSQYSTIFFEALGGFTFSASSCTASIQWYFAISAPAVFSPIPGTPGILSDVSPCRAFTSINSFGVTPYFSITSAVL